jgi:hypothetical protein
MLEDLMNQESKRKDSFAIAVGLDNTPFRNEIKEEQKLFSQDDHPSSEESSPEENQGLPIESLYRAPVF